VIIIKNNKRISKFQLEFLEKYHSNHTTHKIFVELNISEFIKIKEKETGIELDRLTKSRARNLFIDIYDSTYDKVFEVNGNQHYEFNTLFHKNMGDLDRQRLNDSIKKRVVEFFGCEFVEINQGNLREVR